MISTAKSKYIRGSARKARLVIDQIRGKSVGQALQVLTFSPKRAAKTIEECLKSAIANAEQKDSMTDIDELYISRAFIDEGPTMKRMRPRAQGRGFRILKRFHHVTIELDAATEGGGETSETVSEA